MTAWYYSDAQRNRLGPVAAADLAALHDNGQLAPETLVWREGLSNWTPWRELMGEVLGARTPPPAPAASAAPVSDAPARFTVPNDAPAVAAANGYNPYQVVDRVEASPYAAPRAALGGVQAPVYAGEVVYAGFWKRYAAYFIDSFIVGIAGAIVGGVVGAVMMGSMLSTGRSSAGGLIGIRIVSQLIGLGISAAYYGGFHASSSQATPGKQLIGIKVVRADGTPISLGRGVGRFFATLLNTLTIGIGWLMAGFTERKQGLHDLICDTVVVDRWAFTAYPENQRHELGTATVVIIVISALALVGGVLFFGVLALELAGAGMAH